jgi:NADP-dependent 3-hydroxy acid dehydrogenase YdfG
MQRSIEGELAWVTGGGTGIGQAGAVRLAAAGAKIVLTGRRREPLDETAKMIRDKGGEAIVAPADMSKREEVEAVAKRIVEECGRCDILVNSAGINVRNRKWADVDAPGFDSVIDANLSGPFYATAAVLPMMRKQKNGLIIQISSWAGVYVSPLTGPAYSVSKHGLVALSESLNQEECVNGIRSCCICPGEVATPILEKRPVPVSDADKARMLQADDLGETILFVARMPAHVCLNEILISPTWNRSYAEGVKL